MNGTRTRMPSPPVRNNRACATEMVQQNPFASMTVLFGTGIAVGLLLGHTIAEAAGRRLFHEETLTEKMKSQILDVLKSNLPRGLSRHLS